MLSFDFSIAERRDLLLQLFSKHGIIFDEAKQYLILPGLVDVHVHFREPGFSYKETIKSGSQAAARGGFTTVFTMPNLKPVPHSLKNLSAQLSIIKKDSSIRIIPYGSISIDQAGEELSAMEDMAESVCAFSDDGRGVQSAELMRQAMQRAMSLGKPIAAHCEDNALLMGGYIHKGRYCEQHGHRGISSESEYRQLMRDILLAEETGCAYHACHISTKESVEAIRQAKKRGVNISCETAPHYLCLCDEDMLEEGRFKMNPPLRSREDKDALIEGILDSTIDMIATDHAPHSLEEKSRGLRDSLMGVVGLETAFAVMYTDFVRSGRLSLEALVRLMSANPKRRFSLPENDDFTVFEVSTPYVIRPAEFLSKGRATPFEGKTVFGKCLLTVCNGRAVYKLNE